MAAAKTKRRRFGFKVAAFGLSIGVGVIVVEVAVRIVGLAPALPEQYADFIRDPYLPYMRKPGTVQRGTSRSGEYQFEYRHNSRGLRDVEHTVEKPGGVFRILVLGDSFTYGVGAGFEETYPYRLEQLLSARGPGHPRVEIIKAGVPRFFPEIERLQLEHYGIRYAPDLVLVAFTSNDLVDTVRGMDALRPSSTDGYLVSKRSERLGAFGTWLYVRSAAARAVLSRYLARTEEPRQKPKSLKEIKKPDRDAAWLKIEEEYGRMHEIARLHGAGLVVVNIPRAGLERKPAKRLASITDSKPYQFIDVLEDMRAVLMAGPAGPLYWPSDGHCTPDGYDVIARALFRALTTRGLVP